MACRFQTWTLLLGLLLASSILAQEATAVLRGNWTAKTASQTFRGSWGAEISPRGPNEARGYWTLVNGSGERVAQGKWSAKKTGSRWHGIWTAQTEKGRLFSGTWDGQLEESKAKTFSDMLTQTLEKEVAGSWQSGGYSGNWWLNGLKGESVRP